MRPRYLKRYYPELLNLTVDVEAAEEPVTLIEVKDFLRVDGTDQDATLAILISAATQWAENYTRRSFVTRGLKVRFRCFPPTGWDLVLPYPVVESPLTAIAYDLNGANTVIDVAEVIVEPLYGLVSEKSGFTWPSDETFVDFLYNAGYGAAADVPKQIKQAILLAVSSMYELRVDQVVGTNLTQPQDKASEMLLQPYRVWDF